MVMNREDMNQLKRIIRVTGSIHASYSRNTMEMLTIYQMINRMQILLQVPVFLMMYLHDKNTSASNSLKNRLIFSTVENNPLFKKNHEDILRTYHTKYNGIYYLKPENQELIISTEEQDDLSFMIFSRDVTDTEYLSDERRREIKKNECIANVIEHLTVYSRAREAGKGDKTCALFKSLWKELNESEYSRELGYQNRISDLFLDFLEKIDVEKNRSEEDCKPKISKRFKDHELMKQQLAAVDRVVNNIYEMIDDAPILAPKDKFPANILFFHKFYSGNLRTKRFYNRFEYDIRIIIPKKQREHLAKVLEHIAKNLQKANINRSHWFYSLAYGHNKVTLEKRFYETSAVKKPNYPIVHLHNQFVDKLRSIFNKNQTAENLADFFDHLSEPYSSSMMSLADPSLSTGFVTFTQTPFDTNTGGVERLERAGLDSSIYNNPKLDLNDSPDLLKIVSLYYISASMAPSTTQDHTQDHTQEQAYKILNVPIRVAGAQFLNFSFLLNDNDSHQIFWDKSFHFFNDIASQHIKRLRRALREAYTTEIEKLISAFLMDSYQGKNYLITHKAQP